MKLLTSLVLAGAAVLTGCNSNSLFSLDPLVTEEQATFDARLVGTWTNDGKDGPAAIFISREGTTGYDVGYLTDNIMHSLEARLFQAGDAQVLDVSPSDEDNFAIPAHVPVRIWIEGSRLRWAFLDSEWLRGHAARELAQHAVGQRMLVVTPGAAVRGFLVKYAADEQAHGDIATYEKLQ